MINALSGSGLQPIGMEAKSAFPATAAASGGGADFSAMLSGLIGNATGTMQQAEAAAMAGIVGKMPAQAVVEQVLAAERTLQAVIAIRDKAVGSYLEINRMQI